MTPERKRLVLESWQSVAAQHDRIASTFYERLFEIDRHARELFARTNMVDQRAKVVSMLTDIVRDLDHLDALLPPGGAARSCRITCAGADHARPRYFRRATSGRSAAIDLAGQCAGEPVAYRRDGERGAAAGHQHADQRRRASHRQPVDDDVGPGLVVVGIEHRCAAP